MAIARALVVAALVVPGICGLRVGVSSHRPQGAVVASLTLLPDEKPVRRQPTHKDNRQQFFHDLLVLRCSALALAVDVPFHLLYGGGLKNWQLAMLKDVGWTIEDHHADLPFLKSIYRLNKTGPSTHIKSLWVTYMKFFAWRLTQYEAVLHMDAECCFTGGPRPPLTAQFFNRSAGVKFLSSDDSPSFLPERANTHAMLLKPSEATFAEIVEHARAGNHSGRTNTEQDVLETMFPVLQFSRPKIDGNLSHKHGCYKDHQCMERVLGEDPLDLRKKARGVILGRRVTRDAGQMCAAIQECHAGAKRKPA
eukprot:CAMPEP_0204582980 /NCGR_PEP_ID=MMETSP0661-20131031/45519_1 /ASSEMBLY_ACC=CAM_ASM_000606 /TAXON_ID=109239 /ORGANISM="Alexandrium margalefi, Strain AMGDE01CS-322" /LENGTH=307 /DNA_ID=CAMNT_0051592301 /DNA_START=70 /DNA_END=993 /DNA_ORIENTATION=-